MSSSTHDGADPSVRSTDNADPTMSLKDFFVKVVSSERFLWWLGLTAIALDPLFFYVPIVKGGSTCLGLDKMLMIGVVILRTLVDILHDWSWWHKSLRSGKKGPMEKQHSYIEKQHPYALLGRQSRSDEISSPGGGSVALTLLKDLFNWFKNCQIATPCGRSSIPSRVIAIIASLPLPQMVVLTIELRSSFKTWLKFAVLGQLAPRIFRTYPTFVATATNSKIHTWIGAAFNFNLYVYASHAVGGFWYLRAVDRQMYCMKEACQGHSRCTKSSLYCESGNYADNGFIHEICTANPINATKPFDYGIYIGAIKSNLIGSTNLIVKVVEGFWWGLNSLSTMAQSFQSNGYIWDTCFAILICVLGLVLFALLIGNLQMYLQSKMPLTVTKMKEKREELQKWPIYESLPDHLKDKVWRHSSWQSGNGVNLECLLNNIPSKLQEKLKSHFCNNLFCKMKEFEELSTKMKKELREQAKPVIFQARTQIHQKGHPIYEMIHIVHGKVLAYNNDDVEKGLSIKEFKENDSFGEELLQKASEPPFRNLPIATETFQSVTKVEAFALSSDDLATIFTKYGRIMKPNNK